MGIDLIASMYKHNTANKSQVRDEKVNLAKGSSSDSSIISQDETMILDPSKFFSPGEITEPSDIDVICGKGKRMMNHIGNIRYRQLVQSRAIQFGTCVDLKEKNAVAANIVSEIRKAGGHFLGKNDKTGTYHDIGDKDAIKRAKQAMRDSIKRAKQAMRDQSSEPNSIIMSKKFISGDEQKSVIHAQNNTAREKHDLLLPDILPMKIDEDLLLMHQDLEQEATSYQQERLVSSPHRHCQHSPIPFAKERDYDEWRITNKGNSKRYKCLTQRGVSHPEHGHDKSSPVWYRNDPNIFDERGDERSDRSPMLAQSKRTPKTYYRSNNTPTSMGKCMDSMFSGFESIGSFPCDTIENNSGTAVDRRRMENIDLSTHRSIRNNMTIFTLDNRSAPSFDMEANGVPQKHKYG